MTKHVQVYFKTENDAESANASLQKLAIENEQIEPVPDDPPLLSRLIPLNNLNNPETDNHLTHLLHFDVKEEERESALEIIKEHKGHMDPSELESD
ncbi:hypothetical protein MUO14_19440 [Halobacillus shinanisalinarum]|uniref:Uncharacterized protein n=1 Tax=Halobacillus shinanisalinarum TaxID=2932258 RepID=A0ABY4GX60_9BACI|nr:hypothetical protein [Halobacillus shinanisalinarum]UOQ92596.1 hypothetical protein MUO14_19440 [Halobacillus shinanisalinarum]